MENLEAYIQELIRKKTVENIFVRVGDKDRILFDVHSQGINHQTLFDMASVTKVLSTATLSLIAIDRGILSLDTKVSQFYNCPDSYSELNIKHLLTHTMGIGYIPLYDTDVKYDNVAEHILNISPQIDVGTNVMYSCPAYILLGKILEKVMGDSLDKLFLNYVATPLGMNYTSYRASRKINIVNSNQNSEEVGIVNDLNCKHLGGVAGNAGVFSCMSDMTEFAHMLINRGAPLFSENTFVSAATNHTERCSESRGLGFVYVDDRYEQAGTLFSKGSIGHCGHTGQSIFVDKDSGLYVLILSDATKSVIKKLGTLDYNEVMEMRRKIHLSIKNDLKT